MDIKVKESYQDLEPGKEIRNRLYSMPSILDVPNSDIGTEIS
jgi:hypothetical protein